MAWENNEKMQKNNCNAETFVLGVDLEWIIDELSQLRENYK